MGATPQSIDSPPPPPRPPRRVPPHAAHRWYLEFLESCRAIAGLPVMVSLVLEAFDVPTRAKEWGTGAAVIVALILRYFPKLRHMLRPQKGYAFWTALPWLLSASLVFFLIFRELPRRKLLLTESWLKWQTELEKASANCTSDRQNVDKVVRDEVSKAKTAAERDKAMKNKEDKEKPLDTCLAKNLGPVLSESRPPGVASELMAGQLMIANDNIKSALWDRMSADQRFLGQGFSVPNGGSPLAARVPEYLVPNLSDRSPKVLVWKFDHGKVVNQKAITEWRLWDVLNTVPPEYNANFKTFWAQTDASRLLVRFALFDPQKVTYSECLGRPDATRVFMSSLSELNSRTLAIAAQSTGYITPEKIDERGQTMFIWVYAPSQDDQVVRATWGNVLENFGSWIMATPCEKGTE
jgi:hypothetical protein